MVETTDHTAVSREFIVKAGDHLEEGDLLQASEKAWGAAAHQVKAIAQNRGWTHGGHADLFRAVGNIADETGQPEINGLFREASSLHTNFYEGWLTAGQVRGGIEAVKELLALLAPHTGRNEV